MTLAELVRPSLVHRSLVRETLREHRRGTLGWTLGLAAMVALQLAVFPSIRRQSEEMRALLDTYPEAFKAFFGVGGDFASGPGYVAAEVFSFLAPLALLVLAISYGAGATAADEERGRLGLVLANPVRRPRVVLSAAVAGLLALALAGMALFAALWVGGALVDLGVAVGRLAAASIGAVLLASVFGAVALAVGSGTGRRALGAGVAAGLAVASFLLVSLAELTDVLRPWRVLSPFHYASASQALQEGLDPGNVAVLVLLATLFTSAGVAAFNRRDVAG